LAKLGPGVVDYLEQMVARGVEEYYSNAGEAPGQWLGDSAPHLDLDGTVDGDEFRRVLSGAHPTTGEQLTEGKSSPKVVGFDATFCAPKSVSLLFALGGREASNHVRNAHDAAVRDAFDVLQSIARGRRGHDGVRLVAGDGLVGAAYRHRTSRAAEPHLHTHVVIPNLVYAPEDGRWSALDARPLYGWSKTVGHLYQAQLRYELTSRLGVEWQPVAKGTAEMTGFDARVLRAFSTRRREIEHDLQATGRSGAKSAQHAAYRTRRPKDLSLDGPHLADGWRQRAAALGCDDRTLARVTGRTRTLMMPTPGTVEAEGLYRWLARPQGLTAHKSTFDARHVIEAICDALPHGAPIHGALALTEAFLASDHVLALTTTGDRGLRRDDGRLVPSGDALCRFTTPEMVATEQALLARAAARRHEHTGIAQQGTVTAALGRWGLSTEQAAMVAAICRSGAGVDMVEGAAGSGKTTALAAAADAWTTSGFAVHGCSLAARAAARLEDATGIRSTTLALLLGRLDRADILLGDRDVIVVDEAAMVGTRQLHRLLDHADHTSAKVVLIGDPRQLPEIDAGGAYTALDRTLDAARLTTNRRQAEAWERAALAQLRGGDGTGALDTYRAHGRVHEHDDARAAMVHRWMEHRRNREPAVMLAARTTDVEALNRLARRELQHQRLLGHDEVLVDGRGFSVGDEVVALHNDYRVGVLNGTRMTVDYIDRHRRHLYGVDHRGDVARIPFAYIEAGHLAHGYAMTIHKAQGATVERALVLADDSISLEHAYTVLSRATLRTDVYLDSCEHVEREAHGPAPSTEPYQRLLAGVGRSVAQRLAIDQTDKLLVPIDSLRAERDRLQRRLDGRPPDRSRELNDLRQRIGSLRDALEHATRTEHDAHQWLEGLGSVGRRVHRYDRKHLENLEQNASGDIERITAQLGPLVAEHRQLTIEQRQVKEWDQHHAPELDRVDAIDRTIRLHHAVARTLEPTRPSPVRAPERSLGLEL
jgi:conjugative relaxase-like TrwC/TraI family protein